jgi:ribosome-associated protein
MIRISPFVEIDERDISETFVRSSGPGGQNVNKVSTAVELRYEVAKAGLPEDAMLRLKTKIGRLLTQDGIIVIEAQEFRSQDRNRSAALDRLIAMLKAALVRPIIRRATQPTKASKTRRLESKAKRGTTKVLRKSKPSFD